jgi:hypothetical protein
MDRNFWTVTQFKFWNFQPSNKLFNFFELMAIIIFWIIILGQGMPHESNFIFSNSELVPLGGSFNMTFFQRETITIRFWFIEIIAFEIWIHVEKGFNSKIMFELIAYVCASWISWNQFALKIKFWFHQIPSFLKLLLLSAPCCQSILFANLISTVERMLLVQY